MEDHTEDSELHPVLISQPDPNPTVEVGLWEEWMPPNQMACRICHQVTAEEETPAWASELRNFHTDVRVDHGELTCGACHDSDDQAELALPGGEQIGFEHAITLCSQCHSEERADFDLGLHGGMTGHWDRTRGPQWRQTCTDCHDSHAPAPQTVTPVFPPRDRFLVDDAEDANHE